MTMAEATTWNRFQGQASSGPAEDAQADQDGREAGAVGHHAAQGVVAGGQRQEADDGLQGVGEGGRREADAGSRTS